MLENKHSRQGAGRKMDEHGPFEPRRNTLNSLPCWFTREEVVLADVDECSDDHDADSGEVESDTGDIGSDGSENDHHDS